MAINDLTRASGLPRWTANITRSWTVYAEPTQEPISLSLARSHLRLTPYGSPPAHPDDEWITELGIPAARQYCERFIARACAVQTLEMQLSRFPGADDGDGGSGIELMMAPVASVLSIRYLDTAGADQSIDPSSYALSASDPPCVYLASGAAWPATYATPGAVRILYVAGYSPVGSSPQLTPEIPHAVRIAILLMLGNLYENREVQSRDSAAAAADAVVLPLGITEILTPYRLRLSMA